MYETLEEYRKRILALALKRVEEMKENDQQATDSARPKEVKTGSRPSAREAE
ncbi:hypothetical protein bmyco0002_10880 [Bacillus pseudomycoides]|uniref:hypothetical protein n=1 Tax=Bacillus pseudomycoides TaxID=64104 RepID=UPI0001A16914|nr:hypothetical protein [Bacillus pseudomycoides]EEM06228.1 hypothetical protein bmyco0002_10880 [Bacillus pseudomycoides]